MAKAINVAVFSMALNYLLTWFGSNRLINCGHTCVLILGTHNLELTVIKCLKPIYN